MSATANRHSETLSGSGGGLVVSVLVALAYVLFGKLGLLLAQPPGYASPIFLPAGIAVAAVLIVGRRVLPWIFLGSLMLNVWAGYSAFQHFNAMGFAAALAVSLASVLQADIGGWGLRKAVGYPLRLDHGREIVRFLLLAPLICLTSASLSVIGLFALGVVDAPSLAANWVAWWGGDTLGVVVMLPLVLVAAGEPRALWRSRALTVAVPMLLFFALVVVIFLKTSQWEYSDSLNEFRQLSQQAVDQVQTKLEEQDFLLEQTAGLFASKKGGQVTRQEFHQFVQKSLVRFPMIKAIEWAPQVAGAHRDSFEAAQRKSFPGFEIRERNDGGELRRAGVRAVYYPVTYAEPAAGNELAEGFDLASGPVRFEALKKAVQSGSVTMTGPVRLMQESRTRGGVLMLMAINRHEPKYGVVLTELNTADFMDKLLQNVQPMLYARLVDLDERKAMYDNFAPQAEEALFEKSFEFGSRRYRMETAPTPEYLAQHRGWQSLGVLAAGVLGAGMMGSLLLLGTGYTARIETEVEDRTRELKESEEGLKEAQHIGRIGGWEWDALTGVFTCSEETRRILGLDPDMPLPSYADQMKLYTPESAARLDAAVRKSMQTGEPYEIDLELAHSGGTSRWVTARSKIRRDANGCIIGLNGTKQDITERKKAEQALRAVSDELRESRQLLEAIVEHIPVMVFVKSASELRFELFNRAGEKLLGYSRSDLLGKGNYDLWPREQGDWFTAADRKVLASDEVTEIPEEPIQIANGETRYLHTWKIALRDENGKPEHLLGISIDITQRKEAEKILVLYAELVHQMAEGMVLVHSGDGAILLANPAFERMFGYAHGELEGKQIAILNATTEKTPEQTADKIMASLRHTGFWSGEVENIRKDGSRFWTLANVSTFAHPQYGEVWLSIHQDVTERKRIQEALKKSAEEIEDLYDHAPCGYHSLDENGLVIRMNHTELEWLGYGREDIVGKMHFYDLLTPGSKQVFHENFPYFLQTGYVHDLEFEIRRKDGTLLPVLLSGTAIRDEAGRFVASRSTLFDMTERKKLERELERQARTDILTGLNNRRYFFEMAEAQFARVRRYGEPLSLLMLDLDNFKSVNDTYGHHVGDAVLRKLSEVSRHALREIDIIGRLGGEEFAVLLPETNIEKALEAAERMRMAVESAAVKLENGAYLHFTVSIGASSFTEKDTGLDSMLKRADKALYQAKNGGRNRVCVEGAA